MFRLHMTCAIHSLMFMRNLNFSTNADLNIDKNIKRQNSIGSDKKCVIYLMRNINILTNLDLYMYVNP